MEPSDEDWEGFEGEHHEFSFATLRKTPKKIEIVQLAEEEATQELRPSLPRKTIIRTKNKRKNSIVSVEEPRKMQREVEPIQLATFPKNIHIEKLKKVVKLQEHREEHIPLFREKLHVPPGCTIIYRSVQPTRAEDYFTPPPHENPDPNSPELIFDSRFQSGNLQLVFKQQEEYHLQISADTNTKGHRQWFYFSVLSNTPRRELFCLHSFKKKFSLFQIGMRPYCRRRGDASWYPAGFNVRYLREDFKESCTKEPISLKKQEFFLSFEFEFEAGVHYEIASCIPYTTNLLQQRLLHWRTNSPKNLQFKYSVLCRSLTGLDVPLITVNETENNPKHTRYIIVNARTHPGETSSSWVLDGMMEELVNSCALHKIIQDSNIVLKIVPMLNVEGVYIGNYRTGVVGIDFNRLFLTGKPDVFPEVSALKQLVKECKQKGRVELYLDLHGHSILPGCFFYGPELQFSTKSLFKKITKELKHSKYFSSQHCIMGSDSSKAETSRIYFQFQQGIYSLTLENSLGLYPDQTNKKKEKQFESKDWQHFGKELVKSIITIYEQTSFWEREVLRDTRQRKPKYKESYDYLHSSQYEEFSWKKSRTDNDDLSKHIKLLMEIDSDDIDLPNPLSFSQNSVPEETESLNDSDNESDNLSEGKHRELMKMVGKVAQRQRKIQENRSNMSESPQKQEFRSKINKDSASRNQINTFKQYRFGTQDNTLTQWYTRRRLLSVPRPLKNEKLNQSYIIRRTSTKPAAQDQQIFDSIEVTKRIKTEERAPYRKTTTSKFHNDRAQLIIRQKAILEQLLNRKS